MDSDSLADDSLFSTVDDLKQYLYKHFHHQTYPYICNGFVAYLYIVEGMSSKDISSVIINQQKTVSVNIKSLVICIGRVIKEFRSRKKSGLSLPSRQALMKSFLAVAFVIPTKQTTVAATSTPQSPAATTSATPAANMSTSPSPAATSTSPTATTSATPAANMSTSPAATSPPPNMSTSPAATSPSQAATPAANMSTSPSPAATKSAIPAANMSTSPAATPPSPAATTSATTPSTPSQASTTSTPTPTPTNLRSDCLKCSSTKQTFLSVIKDKTNTYKSKVRDARQEVSDVKKSYGLKYITQFRNRKQNQLSKRDATIALQCDEISSLKTDNKNLSAQLSQLEEQLNILTCTNKGLKKENKQLHRYIKDNKMLRNNVRALENSLNKDHEVNVDNNVSRVVNSLQNGKQYSVVLRKVIYFYILLNIPMTAIGKALKYTLQTLTDTTLTRTPSSNSCAQMVRELGILSDLQSVKIILKSASCCLSWDATTDRGSHPNEFHVNTPETSVTLSIRQLPGGKAADYARHIINTLEEVSSLYAEYTGDTKEEILSKIQGKILSTLTDRVAANHATVVLLEEYLGRSLLELNCQLHPLDGLAGAARSALKSLEHEKELKTKSFGSDCQVANVLQLISKLRYKEKGDPAGFKAHLKENGLPCGIFLRYVGNRLHVLFHTAGRVFQHIETLLSYVDGLCKNEQMANALKSDLRQPLISLELQALGLLGKVVTGPWMALFYTAVSERRHLELSQYLRCAVHKLEILEQNADELLITDSDIFGRPLVVDETLLRLRVCEDLPGVSLVISRIVASFITVLKRQLVRYLHGELSEPSEETVRQACAAPVHNIWSERTLGLLDAQARRAPNATESFLDSKCKATVNGTMEWLGNQNNDRQSKLVNFAVSSARRSRDQDSCRQSALHQEVVSRLNARIQSRDMSRRRKVAKSVKAAILGGKLQPGVLDFENSVVTELDSFVKDPKRLIARSISHVWNVDGQDVRYCGKILEVSPKSKDVTISYWRELDEEEDDSVDYKMKLENVLTDLAFGDLVFL